jgi:hypothetical protein
MRLRVHAGRTDTEKGGMLRVTGQMQMLEENTPCPSAVPLTQ